MGIVYLVLVVRIVMRRGFRKWSVKLDFIISRNEKVVFY